ncbi:hypothetical protein C6P46_007094 [Rhodotorula mucilaginosa]|uniref:Uncharacterized protein n=1 Tax=Rhodotorula mucilaginosa TaxID=5537 RepID=A0A9P6VVW2_RHOMI|nr:hypothetical protein C6P46_007094 [Rhodotorula mucilaginosa]
MVRLSHHVFHSFAPIVLLTAYLVTLLAFLAPTPILSSVYLMHVSSPVSAMAVTPGRHYIIGGGYKPRNASRREMVKVVKRAPSVMVPVAIELQIGPLGEPSFSPTATRLNTVLTAPHSPLKGACYTNVTSGGQECQSPSFTPIFSELYDDLSIPSAVVDTLVTQFPFSPTFLFISICLMFVQLLVIASLAAGMHKPQGNLGFIARKQHRIVRVALIIGGVSLALGLAATGALRVIVGHDVKGAEAVAGVTAEVGSGFAQLWAGYVLQLVVVLLLVAEFFATRPGRRKQSADAVLKTEGKAAPILSEKA